jgi:potassium channel LctB
VNVARFLKRARYIFYFWIGINIAFGVIYSYISINSPENGLVFGGKVVTDILDTIYFSFIASTAVGFGDIVPIGFSKIITIVQSLIGIMVLAVLISEIIYGEEKELLKKIHGYSSSNRVKRIRSGFYFFRENMEAIVKKFRTRKRGARSTVDYFNLQMLSLNTNLEEVNEIFSSKPRNLRRELEEEKLVMHMILSLQTLKNAFKYLRKNKVRMNKTVKVQMQTTIKISEKIIKTIGKDLEESNKKQLLLLAQSLKKLS